MTEPRYPYVHVLVSADDVELVSDHLWALGALGIEERDATTLPIPGAEAPAPGTSLLVASFGDDASAGEAQAALEEQGRPSSVEHVVGDEWRDAWREHFHPTKIGERLLLRPSWREVTPAAGDVVLTIDPGGAFGSGIHETTRLVLREIDARVRGGERVLDVGCGSGILAVGALLLGAAEAYGTDIEDVAIDVTMENATLNGVAARMRADTRDVRELEGAWELVLANIQAPVLIAMADPLAARVAPGGALVLSGILAGQEDAVRDAFVATGLTHVETTAENEWRAVVLARP
ncbi:MAG: 50S ribosomal protein L11 methyltransferase [Myxococcales bacterium]|nr:50S ribosomal protein L11 methyltransferase [Myxococcales bacterium]